MLRIASSARLWRNAARHREPEHAMKVGDMCTRNPATVSTSATLAEVARVMKDRHVGSVIVTQTLADRPVVSGVITDRDVACAQLDRRSDLASLSAGEVMTRNPLVINEDDSLDTAIEKLRARMVRRAPVVSATGALVGVVSTDDLFAYVARELMLLARLITLQPRQEAARMHNA
jgi:CBS domain-containing protein